MITARLCAARHSPLDALQHGRATFPAMRSQKSFFFAYFWFSHRPADGEASA
jgi:hypothetical protein